MKLQAPRTPAIKVLVVDDEPECRDVLAKLLSGDGHVVDLAADGQVAWDKVQTISYDCILLDLRMPVMSGQRLFRLIEEFNGDLAKKVIFLTWDTFSPESRDFLSSINNPVLEKPFVIEELRKQLAELTEQSYEPKQS